MLNLNLNTVLTNAFESTEMAHLRKNNFGGRNSFNLMKALFILFVFMWCGKESALGLQVPFVLVATWTSRLLGARLPADSEPKFQEC